MVRPRDLFKDFGQGFFACIRRLEEARIVLRSKQAQRDKDWSWLHLPADIAFLRDKAELEGSVAEYVEAVFDGDRWGLVFQDRSIAMISYRLDEPATHEAQAIVPRSLCYVFASPQSESQQASFYRIEMHPEECGTLFGEPIIHLHGNRNKTPRFAKIPPPSPIEFLDFVVRDRFPKYWAAANAELSESIVRMHRLERIEQSRLSIAEPEAYDREAENLQRQHHQRFGRVPEWVSPNPAKRYPFGL